MLNSKIKERFYPVVKSLWALISSSIDTIKILGLQEAGHFIVKELKGDNPLEKLKDFELGDDNLILIPGEELGLEPYWTVVILKVCPFTMSYKYIPKWDERSRKIVEIYNKAQLGPALHPLCILHQALRKDLKAYTIACRSAITNKTVYSIKLIQQFKLEQHKIEPLIKDNACIYLIKTN